MAVQWPRNQGKLVTSFLKCFFSLSICRPLHKDVFGQKFQILKFALIWHALNLSSVRIRIWIPRWTRQRKETLKTAKRSWNIYACPSAYLQFRSRWSNPIAERPNWFKATATDVNRLSRMHTLRVPLDIYTVEIAARIPARRVPFGRRLVLCSLHMHSLWFHSLARSTSVVCSIRLCHCRSSSSDSTTISRFTQVGLHSWCKIKADKTYIFREAEQVTANGPSAAHTCSPPHHPTTVPHPSARRMADASWAGHSGGVEMSLF